MEGIFPYRSDSEAFGLVVSERRQQKQHKRQPRDAESKPLGPVFSDTQYSGPLAFCSHGDFAAISAMQITTTGEVHYCTYAAA